MPINAGGRLTGRAGRYSVGVLNIQTGDEEAEFGAPATNFTVVRVKRDVLRRSSIGCCSPTGPSRRSGPAAIARTASTARSRSSRTCRSTPTGRGPTPTDWARGDDTSYRGQLDYSGDRYGVQLERLNIGDDFNPGGRLRAPRRHVARLRALQVQPAPAQPQRHPQVRL